jgi:hypothetical protein
VSRSESDVPGSDPGLPSFLPAPRRWPFEVRPRSGEIRGGNSQKYSGQKCSRCEISVTAPAATGHSQECSISVGRAWTETDNSAQQKTHFAANLPMKPEFPAAAHITIIRRLCRDRVATNRDSTLLSGLTPVWGAGLGMTGVLMLLAPASTFVTKC